MSDKELVDLIHSSVGDIFSKNADQLYPKINSLVSRFRPSTQDELKNQTESLLHYTMLVSEMSCIAMAKTLASLGILEVPSTDD